jgi:flagellar biosynthesis protein FlhF
MIVKRFLAGDMQGALRKISEEMGPEAVILEQKFVRAKGIAGFFKKKMVQVTAVYDPYRPKAQKEEKPEPKPKEQAAPRDTAAFGSEQARQLQEIKELVKELSEKTRAAEIEAEQAYSPDVQGIYDTLVRRDVNEQLSKEIADKTRAIMEQKGMDAHSVARQLILDRLGEPYPLKLKKFEQNVLLFAGPTGAGKTTTVAKLAGMLKFRENLKVGLINTDTYRVGAMEHIRIFAGKWISRS